MMPSYFVLQSTRMSRRLGSRRDEADSEKPRCESGWIRVFSSRRFESMMTIRKERAAGLTERLISGSASLSHLALGCGSKILNVQGYAAHLGM
jgi:hypothetical protein